MLLEDICRATMEAFLKVYYWFNFNLGKMFAYWITYLLLLLVCFSALFVSSTQELDPVLYIVE